MQFPVDLGSGASLVLREESTAPRVLELVTGDIERIRRYEAWAHDEQSSAAMLSFTRYLLNGYAAGTIIPTVIAVDGHLVGALTARIDASRRSGELGYWIVGDHSGKGLVTRACEAMLVELRERGLHRAIIRTAAENEKSIGVARRLGFTIDAVRAGAFPVAGVVHDEMIMGLELRQSVIDGRI